MKFLRIPAVCGTLRPTKSWIKTGSEEIWAVQKKHIRKLCTEFLENKIIWADFLVQFPQTTAFQTYFLEQIIIHTLVQDGAV